MVTHIIAVVTFNRTSIHTSMLSILLILASFAIFAIAKIHSIEKTENDDNHWDNYFLQNNADDNELYDNLSSMEEDELYQDDRELKLQDLYSNSDIDFPFEKQYPEKDIQSENQIGNSYKDRTPFSSKFLLYESIHSFQYSLVFIQM